MAKKPNAQNIMQEASNIDNWKSTHKKSYSIWMCRPAFGTKVSNFLEGSNYTTDVNKQFVLSGTAGEQWVVDVNKLAKTYTFEDGTPITPESLQKKCDKADQIDWVKLTTKPDAGTNYAFFLDINRRETINFPVKTSWGELLLANRPEVQHLKGDFLVCADKDGHPNLNDVWVVNGEIFPKTYDLHAFPNMFDTDKVNKDPDKPDKSLIKPLAEALKIKREAEKARQEAEKAKQEAERPINKLVALLKEDNIPILSVVHNVDAPVNPDEIGIDFSASKLDLTKRLLKTLNVYKTRLQVMQLTEGVDLDVKVDPNIAKKWKYMEKFTNLYNVGKTGSNSIAIDVNSGEFILFNNGSGNQVVEGDLMDLDIEQLGYINDQLGINVDTSSNCLYGNVDSWTINFTENGENCVDVFIDQDGKGTFTINTVIECSSTLYKGLSLNAAATAIKGRLKETNLKEWKKVSEIKESWGDHQLVISKAMNIIRESGEDCYSVHVSKDEFDPQKVNSNTSYQDTWLIRRKRVIPGVNNGNPLDAKIVFQQGQNRTPEEIAKYTLQYYNSQKIAKNMGPSAASNAQPKSKTKSLIGGWMNRK
jgi:hypothetical protein